MFRKFFRPATVLCEETVKNTWLQDWGNPWKRQEPKVTSLLLVGPTGSGKSTTGNLLSGTSTFATSSGFSSCTVSISTQDYQYADDKIRVIDTVGLFDTELSIEETMNRLATFAQHTPNGVGALVIVVRRGRFTDEQDRALRLVQQTFGNDVLKHCVIVFTHCEGMRNADLAMELENLKACYPNHRLVQWIKQVPADQLVAVGNGDPMRAASDRRAIHNAVENAAKHGVYDHKVFRELRAKRQELYDSITSLKSTARQRELEELANFVDTGLRTPQEFTQRLAQLKKEESMEIEAKKRKLAESIKMQQVVAELRAVQETLDKI